MNLVLTRFWYEVKRTKTQLNTIKFILRVTGMPRIAHGVLFEMVWRKVESEGRK